MGVLSLRTVYFKLLNIDTTCKVLPTVFRVRSSKCIMSTHYWKCLLTSWLLCRDVARRTCLFRLTMFVKSHNLYRGGNEQVWTCFLINILQAWSTDLIAFFSGASCLSTDPYQYTPVTTWSDKHVTNVHWSYQLV